MTQDEIIEMARQAEFVNLDLCSSELERFAKLVAAKEREKFCVLLRQFHDSISLASDPNVIRARGEA